jgi:hypothetical protein
MNAAGEEEEDGGPKVGETTGRADAGGLLTAALALVAVLGLLGTVGFGLAWNTARHRQDNQRAVQIVARQFILALTNFDGKTIDADVARISSFATGTFATQVPVFFTADFRKAAQQVGASSRGQILYLLTEDVHSGTADVFTVVDQTIVNNKFKAPEADELRVELALTKVKGAWRISNVTVLQAPPVNTPLTGTSGGSTTTAPTTPPTTVSTPGSTTP